MELYSDSFLDIMRRTARRPPHAIVLAGYAGHDSNVEANDLAQLIAAKTGQVRSLRRAEDKTRIGVAQIQQLYRESRSKQPEGRDVWVIEEAHLLSADAQNALLKLLEEPPAAVVFILAVRRADSLLPTVRSRCSIMACAPYDQKRCQAWLAAKKLDATEIATQLNFLSEGSVSEMTHLGDDVQYREQMLGLAVQAKTLVFGAAFDKIVTINQLAGDRDKALRTVRLGLRMLVSASTRQAEDVRYAQALQVFELAHERLLQNGNVKAQLLRAVV